MRRFCIAPGPSWLFSNDAPPHAAQLFRYIQQQLQPVVFLLQGCLAGGHCCHCRVRGRRRGRECS